MHRACNWFERFVFVPVMPGEARPGEGGDPASTTFLPMTASGHHRTLPRPPMKQS